MAIKKISFQRDERWREEKFAPLTGNSPEKNSNKILVGLTKGKIFKETKKRREKIQCTSMIKLYEKLCFLSFSFPRDGSPRLRPKK